MHVYLKVLDNRWQKPVRFSQIFDFVPASIEASAIHAIIWFNQATRYRYNVRELITLEISLFYIYIVSKKQNFQSQTRATRSFKVAYKPPKTTHKHRTYRYALQIYCRQFCRPKFFIHENTALNLCKCLK